jgi:hypothetical protein
MTIWHNHEADIGRADCKACAACKAGQEHDHNETQCHPTFMVADEYNFDSWEELLEAIK